MGLSFVESRGPCCSLVLLWLYDSIYGLFLILVMLCGAGFFCGSIVISNRAGLERHVLASYALRATGSRQKSFGMYM
jgi:hypothetical protein